MTQYCSVFHFIVGESIDHWPGTLVNKVTACGLHKWGLSPDRNGDYSPCHHNEISFRVCSGFNMVVGVMRLQHEEFTIHLHLLQRLAVLCLLSIHIHDVVIK